MLTNKLSCYIFIILGHWLGNQSLPIFTVIDTPGFGNDLIEEERTIEGKKPVADFVIVTFYSYKVPYLLYNVLLNFSRSRQYAKG